MRIAFTGCSGTGKTTLAKIVSQIYNIPYNPVGARSVAAEMGLETPYDADRLGVRAEFQERLIQAKYDWESKHTSFVTDRTAWDQQCYAKLALPDHSFSADYYQTAAATDGEYDLVFFTPMSAFQTTGGDPARVDDTRYHLAFEALLKTRFTPRHYWVFANRLSIRVRYVINVIEGCG